MHMYIYIGIEFIYTNRIMYSIKGCVPAPLGPSCQTQARTCIRVARGNAKGEVRRVEGCRQSHVILVLPAKVKMCF